jgi:hypothetical protein
MRRKERIMPKRVETTIINMVLYSDTSHSIEVLGDVSDIAVLLAYTMRTNPEFERAIRLAQAIRGLP